MNKRKIHQTVKYLYKYKEDDIQIIQMCVYDFDTDKIFVRIKNEFQKNYCKSRISKKKNIPNKERTFQTTCNILKTHAKDMKEDPERLSTKFLQRIIGIECM